MVIPIHGESHGFVVQKFKTGGKKAVGKALRAPGAEGKGNGSAGRYGSVWRFAAAVSRVIDGGRICHGFIVHLRREPSVCTLSSVCLALK
ncbi:hypothetical protein SDC9_66245 [bioreactor metagenome]|uniref:Uncharacterized protein n=1 Tax=bioreactor metagenome TaxID=1076179 RepID=A0A644XUR2_9ZZZZ